LLDVQADLLSELATRVVVPLTPVAKLGGKPLTRLNPTIRVLGKDHVALFQELAAIPESALREPVASAGARRPDLVAALDLLFTGI
jgi:toxin CcdB